MHVGFDIANAGLPGDGDQIRQRHRETAQPAFAEIDVAQLVRRTRCEYIILSHQARGRYVLAGTERRSA